MKRFLFFAALLLCASLPSCQCAEKPDVGPVEGENESARVQTVDVRTPPLA
ncbi:MAG: hypothetical protein ABEL51_13515 [Salinibacter sp.]